MTALKNRCQQDQFKIANNGLHFLLDVANRVISPVKDFNKENDYVKMFKENKVDKFPALSSHFKPLFVLSKQFNN